LTRRFHRTGAAVLGVLAALLLVPAVAPMQATAQQSGVARALLAQVDELRKERKEAEALETADRAADVAKETGDVVTEGDAARAAGRILYSMGRYSESQQRYERSRAIAVANGDRLREAQVMHGLANAAWGQGYRAVARANYLRAIALYTELAMTHQALEATHGLSFVMDDPGDNKRLIELAIADAVASHDAQMEGVLRQDAGDIAFTEGRYAEAYEQLQAAARIAEASDDREQQAFVLTSMGRLYRAHGELDMAATMYGSALALQEQIKDVYGQIQSLNAIGSTLARQERFGEALAVYDRAVERAANVQSPRIDRFLSGARATALNGIGAYAQSLSLLLAAMEGEEDPYVRTVRKRAIATAYLGLGNQAAALDQLDQVVSASRDGKMLDELPRALVLRAQVRETAGDLDGAAADAAEASALLEEMRQQLVPSDYMKRGFSDDNQYVYGLNIAMSTRRGDARDAFLSAERGRARAFLDLLALRGELRQARTAVDAAPVAGTATLSQPVRAAGLRADLTSPLAATTPSMDRLAATAARLESTILSYWVGDEATFLWVMTPGGEVRVRRIQVSKIELDRLVRETLPQATPAGSEPAASAAAPRHAGLQLPAAPLQALRRLHALLIEPAAALLPASGRVTVVPHGPLFKLSFAALKDKRGRYLIERYSVHYAPSLATLEFTALSTARPRRDGYLLVADPAPLPSVIDSVDGRPRPLARLPGSGREARAIAALLPPGEATILDRAGATEPLVKAALHGKRVLHLATHGVVRDSDPLSSFIAVASTGRDAAHDGRLTAEELYDLDLDSDLVVLSACRSADGPVSGDGIFALTRALLSAGVPSVIGSAWEVADEPTAQLMPDFYKRLLRSGSKIDSLRDAQLSLIRSLRAGRVRAQTPLGRITLPEHPFFWAGFMLIGEPK